MDIEKGNEFNFLKEEFGKFSGRWIQSLVNARNQNYARKIILLLMRRNQIIYSVFRSNLAMCC